MGSKDESNLLVYIISNDKKYSEFDGLFEKISSSNSLTIHGYYRLLGIKNFTLAKELLSKNI